MKRKYDTNQTTDALNHIALHIVYTRELVMDFFNTFTVSANKQF